MTRNFLIYEKILCICNLPYPSQSPTHGLQVSAHGAWNQLSPENKSPGPFWLVDSTPRQVLASDPGRKGLSIVSVGRVGAPQWPHPFIEWIGLSQITAPLKHASRKGRVNFRKSAAPLPGPSIRDLCALRKSFCSAMASAAFSFVISLRDVWKDRNIAIIIILFATQKWAQICVKGDFLSALTRLCIKETTAILTYHRLCFSLLGSYCQFNFLSVFIFY